MVEYKKGTENRAADALSRREEDQMNEVPLMAKGVTTMQPMWLQYIKDMVNSSDLFKILNEKLQQGRVLNKHYKEKGGYGSARAKYS